VLLRFELLLLHGRMPLHDHDHLLAEGNDHDEDRAVTAQRFAVASRRDMTRAPIICM